MREDRCPSCGGENLTKLCDDGYGCSFACNDCSFWWRGRLQEESDFDFDPFAEPEESEEEEMSDEEINYRMTHCQKCGKEVDDDTPTKNFLPICC